MFSLTHENWEAVCDMYFNQKMGRLKAYLQWFPFSKLSKNDRAKIKSESYFKRYIQNGAGVLFPPFLLRTDNYMQKGDGSFRNSSLLSPLLYLLMQSIGKTISLKYQSQRPKDISAYYAGNFDEMRCFYKQDYDVFCKEINAELERYDYFIKTDIRDFFGNINLNKLFQRIDEVANANEVLITQNHLQLFKDFLAFCGDGKFPLVENSVTSSYLATVVYLDDIDIRLYEYISSKIMDLDITGFKMIRYVDDLYILLRSNKTLSDLKPSYNEILNEYSTILKEYNLAINSSKVCLKQASDINDELKKSLYDEYFNGIKFEIAELAPNSIIDFLDNLEMELRRDNITIEQYTQIINKSFCIEKAEFTPSEAYNYFIYENTQALRSEKAVKILLKILHSDISFISLDPKRLTTMIIKTQNKDAIKAFLNHLFIRNRAGKWNSYDTTIAINYLILSRFRHIDLIKVLRKHCPDLYDYYQYFCKYSFASALDKQKENVICNLVQSDKKTFYLYTMYIFENSKGNTMAAFAYFKNFFDRITAHMAFASHYDNSKKPNYNMFYKEKEHKKFYNCIKGAVTIIEKAHELRNANPLSHASAELIDNNNSTKELLDSIENMKKLVADCCHVKGLL